MVFREHIPTRSNIKTVVVNYAAHRVDLRRDYQNRCGYCDDVDTWRFSWFEIDHLVPQKYLVSILPTDYSNLVYACRSCNNSKRAQWPTKKEEIHNHNDEGFIDPCDASYSDQFSRAVNGRIVAETNLGAWMYKALKFYKPQHEIIWNIEQLDNMIDEIEALSADSVLLDQLLDCYRNFRKYVKELSEAGFQKSI
ncbi:MAG: HNH endonuclease [Chitinophagaceae bacterium]|nr:HNH endonuclease [Chitinophagaceae bacterium]